MIAAKLLATLLLISIQSFLSAALTINSNAVPSPSNLFEGYNMTVATFTGTVFGEEFTLNGTTQEVIAKLEQQYPQKDVLAEVSNLNGETFEEIIEKRNKGALLCIPVAGQPWQKTSVDAAALASADLAAFGGRIGVASRACARISCRKGRYGRGAGVYLCNDNHFPIDPASPYIASYVRDTYERCREPILGAPVTLTGGQLFDSDYYNVITILESC